MSFDTLRQQVENHFQTVFTGDLADVDFGGNNEFESKGKTKWYRLGINPFGSQNAAVGKDFQRTRGIIQVQCFVPLNTGEKVLGEMCKEVQDTFQNEEFGSVKCFATSSLRVGESGNWYQFNANTEFLYDNFS